MLWFDSLDCMPNTCRMSTAIKSDRGATPHLVLRSGRAGHHYLVRSVLECRLTASMRCKA